MTGTNGPRDEAVEKELAGVPEELLDQSEEGDGHSLDDALASLRGDLEKAQQDMLYARAEVQNVRRRMEKEAQDARAYAATGFARDILAVADNLARALDHVPPEMRDNDKLKGFLAGLGLAPERTLVEEFLGNAFQFLFDRFVVRILVVVHRFSGVLSQCVCPASGR